MRTHEEIDSRGLALARAVARRIDDDPARSGLERARRLCVRWQAQRPSEVCREWLAVLEKPWPEVRKILLDRGEEGRRLRQSSPFCGVLKPQERWAIYRAQRRS